MRLVHLIEMRATLRARRHWRWRQPHFELRRSLQWRRRVRRRRKIRDKFPLLLQARNLLLHRIVTTITRDGMGAELATIIGSFETDRPRLSEVVEKRLSAEQLSARTRRKERMSEHAARGFGAQRL